MSDTLQLNLTTWDLMTNGYGNIAMQTGSAAIIQDVSSALKTFKGEAWYDASLGVPYFSTLLGQPLNVPLFTGIYNSVALTVPGVVSAQTTFTALSPTRKLMGTVEVIDTYGQALGATF